jgi:ATP-dependent helicase/nuclease subunit B
MMAPETARSNRANRGNRVDAWLAEGGLVLTATERAARSVAAAFHEARRNEGHSAWVTPAVKAWDGWIREQWLERDRSGLVLLNPLQEQALWVSVIRNSVAGRGLLHPDRLASAAQRGYRLLCDYAPGSLVAKARGGWTGDSAIFSEWIGDFETRCRRDGLLSASRLGLELAQLLADDEVRGPLLLIGFDRLLEAQTALLTARGDWQVDQTEVDGAVHEKRFFQASDSFAELSACVAWLREKLKAKPEARLLVVTPNLRERRGELERALLAAPEAGEAELPFEFSLGVPLDQVGVARSALLLLRWLDGSLTEAEVDWLATSGHVAASVEEEIALAEAMRELRRRGLERTSWSLEAFAKAGGRRRSALSAWEERVTAARKLLRQMPARQSSLEWVELAERLLETAGWPGFRPLGSSAFQAWERWEKVLESCGTLGFDGSPFAAAGMDWAEFVSAVSGAVSETIFARESSDAAIQITEPLESAGQLADGIWFLGADEENWPGRGTAHPLLPLRLQREAKMPHSSPGADWELAQVATGRLLASAEEVIFSYSAQMAEGEARPSRLALGLVGEPVALPALRTAGVRRKALTEVYEDWSRIPFPHTGIEGGAATLTSQSRCAFQAFATARLGAQDWRPAEAGLNAKQRGQLLHAVLHRVWNPVEGGIGTLEELRAVPDLFGFVNEGVRWVVHEKVPPGLRETLPERFLDLEVTRLTRLVTHWLEYERERLPFRVAGTEVSSEIEIAGLSLRLRLDRVDVLGDGSNLVIDYKTGSVGPSAWDGERPDDVQLPLYATFAAPEELQGLVFARVKPGDLEFYGRVRNATAALRGDLSSRSALVCKPLDDRQLEDWRRRIEQLGRDFLTGRADVDPKEFPNTCDRCHLHPVCRIYENQAARVGGEDEEGDGRQEGAGE